MTTPSTGRVTGGVVEGDVHRLRFDDDRFDVTVAVTVCEFGAEPAQVIAGLVRVARPGGRVVIGSLRTTAATPTPLLPRAP